jgi:AcrR family transcriptional regulator
MTAATTERPQSLREEHKLVTRARIRRCARICFGRDGVPDVSLEIIALEAGIGRTTLYQYYPSKNLLLIDLMEQSLRATDRVYDRLVALDRIDFDGVRGWLSNYLREVEDHTSSVDMFHGAIENDERVRQMLRDHWMRTMAALGARFPAFDLRPLSGAERTRRQIAAELALSEIERFCGSTSLPDYPHDREAALDVIADRFLKILI